MKNGNSELKFVKQEDQRATLGTGNKQEQQSILNYTVKYAGREHQWFERNCEQLHKGKKITLEYMLGQ